MQVLRRYFSNDGGIFQFSCPGCAEYDEGNFARTFSMSTGLSIHSSVYPHAPQTYRDNPTQPAMVKAMGMMLLLVLSDEADTTRISRDPHFGHELLFFMGLL